MNVLVHQLSMNSVQNAERVDFRFGRHTRERGLMDAAFVENVLAATPT